MIRAVLFDFGGVITSSPFEAFAAYEERQGLPADFIRTVNSTNPDTNAWARLERSEVSMGVFATAFAAESKALGHEVDGADVLALLAGDVRPDMVEAVRRCREHLTVACLTNNFAGPSSMGDDSGADDPGKDAAGDHGGIGGPSDDAVDAAAEAMALFDLVIESRVVGVRKPDPAFYRLACDQLSIEPSEAVFLDDLGINLKPARAMGMTTIKVTDPNIALDQLETIVGFKLRE